MWLWSGVVVFCAAVLGTQIYLTRQGSRGVAERLGAYLDRVALVAGVVVLLVVQFLVRRSSDDAIFVWVCGLWWGLATTQLVHLVRVKRGAVSTTMQ
jgi:glycerol-3-phosphate acyltransferase PlsY